MAQEHRRVNLRTAAIALAGMLVGGSNQVLAFALVMWSDGIVHDMLTLYFGSFCLLWTAWTIVLNVLVGWNVTRCVQSSLCSKSRRQRTIGMDAMHITEHMVLSTILLFASMTILHCLPVKPSVENYPNRGRDMGVMFPPPFAAGCHEQNL
jgi:hypothetical protein